MNTCQNCKNEFLIDADDAAFYEKIQVPHPTFCPTCRMIRRCAFRNQNKLFKVKDAFTGDPLFSLIPPDSGVPVITSEEWFSDSWNGMDHGQDVDFTKPFLLQLFSLHAKIPQLNLNASRMVNSAYSGNATDLKNCYMVFNATDNEDCMYGTGYYGSKNCIDNCDIYQAQYCYGNFWLNNCNQVHFSEECTECANVWFLKNCIGCINCIGCANLKNKSYCIFNQQYDKDSYEVKLKELRLDTHSGVARMQKEAHAFWNTFPKKYIQGVKNTHSTGVYVTQSKNVKDSYMISEAEDLRYCQFVSQAPNKDCYDISVWGSGSELAYEYASSGNGVYNVKFISDCWPNIRNVEYSLHCNSISDCFGCVGLKNAQYCILNKQYTKEEYEALVPKIKKHMVDMPYIGKDGCAYWYGEFFPIEFSWYGYNNTLAYEFMPITKEEALAKGYPWYEIPKGNYTIELQAADLPDAISNVPDDIVKKVIGCERCGGAYRLQSEEIALLKKELIPLPHMCPDCRHQTRLSRRLKPQLFERACMKEGCTNTFMTGYDPKNNDIVYCEKCYQNEFS